VIDTFGLPRHRVIERLIYEAPLGLRFRDPLDGSAVEGLSVVAHAIDRPTQRVDAAVNRSGVYVFHRLPGLPRRFAVHVDDPAGRFMPMRFDVDAPTQGLVRLACVPVGSPPGIEASGVPLFSSAERGVPPGAAVVRAELWDALAERPAAWAVVDVFSAGGTTPLLRGIADAAGRVALMFAYPEPLDGGLGSPPAALPLSQQAWPLTLSARYTPGLGANPLPDVCALLAQPRATLWADATRTTPLAQVTLRFGAPLVLRTHDGAAPLSQLWITAAGSPP
jgi:hypothetical protein